MDFSNKTAVVTGGATGIGRHTAEALLSAGAKVAVMDVKREEGEAFAALSERAAFFYCDVRSVEGIRNTFTAIESLFGPVDILLNGAGLANRTPALDITEEEWDLLNDVNLKATFFCSQAAARSMVSAKRKGRIINLASVRAQHADGTHTIYDATKSGVQAVTRSFAVALADKGITANTIAPGYVLSPMTAHNLEREGFVQWLSNRVPLGRMIEYDEVINTILFFCSDEASGITGQNLYVDGGWSVHA